MPLARGFHSPLSLFSLCVLTFSVSALFLTGFHEQGVSFWSSSKVRLWHFISALSPTLWVASVLAMFKDWRETLGSVTRGRRMELGIAIALAALTFLTPSLHTLFAPQAAFSIAFERSEELLFVPDFSAKYFTRLLLSGAVVMLHISGMFGVHAQLLSQLQHAPHRVEETGTERLAEEVRRYQQLRSRLERFLGFAAANIAVSILWFSALNALLDETAPVLAEWFPRGAAMSFGIYSTWLLAIIYLPIRKTLNDVGQGLADELFQQSRAPHLHWKQWFEERQAIHTFLGLQGSALQDLQQALFVLGPVLAGLSSLTLGA
ncbi:hypothetical protein [Archangium lansingense]|uniref:Uncharacterized protein n=1 Tax=Archangium lansingense TaxID=2995310 RepID=A0ABT4A5Z7_9BACT|nr:hypothetical protein [Archangium lansinium]MCY1077083.1 hypothetical protein [Archangium lansinium]